MNDPVGSLNIKMLSRLPKHSTSHFYRMYQVNTTMQMQHSSHIKLPELKSYSYNCCHP